MTNTYIALDLETTGLNPKQDKIIEIGAVKVMEGRVVEEYGTFINPGRKLEERIVELTGIRQEDLEGAPYMEEVLDEVLTFLGDEPLLGHQLLFDYACLKRAAVNGKRSFEKKGMDTLKIARKYLPELEQRRLGYLCEYYGIPHRAHRALDDARATHELYQHLVASFYKEDDKLFVPIPLQYTVKRDTPATKAQKERLYRLIEQHKLDLNLDVERLTRSEASRITDKILSANGH